MNQEQTSALEKAVRTNHANIAGMAVWKDGAAVYENYFNGCGPQSPIHVFSVTKSVVSALVGIAIGKGYIQSVRQKVLDFFPQYVPKRGEKTLQTITVENLLTMTAPYKYRSAPYTKYFTSDDWVKAALDLLGGKGPVGTFRYTPLIGPDILSGILASATGLPPRRFAAQHLFGPLGIAVGGDITFKDKEEQLAFLKAKNTGGWVADPKGINTAGWGLALTATHMAKIGQLYLNQGSWEGRQLLPAQWVEESTREHSRWPELDLPYGYLWWAGHAGGYAAMGDSGNVIYVNPPKNLVVAIASLYKPSAKDRIPLITEYIEPFFNVFCSITLHTRFLHILRVL